MREYAGTLQITLTVKHRIQRQNIGHAWYGRDLPPGCSSSRDIPETCGGAGLGDFRQSDVFGAIAVRSGVRFWINFCRKDKISCPRTSIPETWVWSLQPSWCMSSVKLAMIASGRSNGPKTIAQFTPIWYSPTAALPCNGLEREG